MLSYYYYYYFFTISKRLMLLRENDETRASYKKILLSKTRTRKSKCCNFLAAAFAIKSNLYFSFGSTLINSQRSSRTQNQTANGQPACPAHGQGEGAPRRS